MLWGIPNALKDRLKMHARDFALNRFREREYNLDPLVLAGFCQKLRNKKPDYLYGYSSMIYEFALFLHERGINARDFGLKAVFYSAESLHPYQRDLIEAVFGCTVAGEYGAAETGVITFQCPSGKHHIADDCVLVELLDERGREVSVGQIGRVTVTVLHSFSAPIIRYQLGDLATKTSDPCSCGISLSVLDGIVGRTAGIILTPSGRCFHSISVYYIMKEFTAKFGSIRQFRVVQPCLDKLEFHMAVQQGFGEQAERWLERRVWQTFGPDMRVTFQMHETIPRSPSGKLSDFESRLDTRTQLLASFRLGDVGQVD
jgi:phenylacetate-CoA ligase